MDRRLEKTEKTKLSIHFSCIVHSRIKVTIYLDWNLHFILKAILNTIWNTFFSLQLWKLIYYHLAISGYCWVDNYSLTHITIRNSNNTFNSSFNKCKQTKTSRLTRWFVAILVHKLHTCIICLFADEHLSVIIATLNRFRTDGCNFHPVILLIVFA